MNKMQRKVDIHKKTQKNVKSLYKHKCWQRGGRSDIIRKHSQREGKRVKEKEVEKTSRKALDKRGTLW